MRRLGVVAFPLKERRGWLRASCLPWHPIDLPMPTRAVMNTNGAAGAKPIVCFMWRPEGRVLRDGGFRRAYAILERLSSHVHVSIIDRHPSPLSKNSSFPGAGYPGAPGMNR